MFCIFNRFYLFNLLNSPIYHKISSNNQTLKNKEGYHNFYHHWICSQIKSAFRFKKNIILFIFIFLFFINFVDLWTLSSGKNPYLQTFSNPKAEILAISLSKLCWALFCLILLSIVLIFSLTVFYKVLFLNLN